MACGCPVICSNNTSLPEVSGKAALFFDSNNIKELTEKLSLVLNNKKIKKELIQKGFENIKRFDWKKTAKETFEVYREVLEKNKNKGIKNKNTKKNELIK
jgi:glycosyltransferase involved in cell wall biosynthesis